jgi:hypothetical protein
LPVFLNGETEDVYYSRHGVLKFATFIAADIVTISDTKMGEGMRFGESALFSTRTAPVASLYENVLTDKGRLFVEA